MDIMDINDNRKCETLFFSNMFEHNKDERIGNKPETVGGQPRKAGIFLVLSDYKQSMDNEKKNIVAEKYEGYKWEEDGKIYQGYHTNDAPIQCLIDNANLAGYDIAKIVCVCIKSGEKTKVLDEENTIIGFDKPTTCIKRFETLVKEYLAARWGDDNVTICPVQYDAADLTNFYRKLNSETNDLDAFFVDYTGGLRDTSFLMVAAIKFLEFKGIKCEKVIYSDFFSRPKQLKTLNNVYGLFNIINGMSEFVSSGTTRQLDAALQEQGNSNALVQAIRAFAHATNVGDIGNLDKCVGELQKALEGLDSEDDLESVMISSMKEVIKNKIFGVNSDKPLISEDSEGNTKINYYRLINWCIENKMYQQAATLYIEKVPVVYWNEKIISEELVPLSDDASAGSSQEVKTFYCDLPQKLTCDEKFAEFDEKICLISFQNSFTETTYHKDTFLNECKLTLDGFNDAYARFAQIIEAQYPTFRREHDSYSPENYESEIKINQWNINGFLKSLPNQRKVLYYLFYGNLDRYNGLSKDKNKDKARLLAQIKIIHEKNEYNDLCILLAYYLAIKLLRNKMSHASENNDDAAVIKELQRFFKDQLNTEVTISLKEEDIKKILDGAMQASETAQPFTGGMPTTTGRITEETAPVNNSPDDFEKIHNEILQINVPVDGINGNLKYYIQIVIYVLKKQPEFRASLNEIKGNLPIGIELPERRTLSVEGKKSGIKLISEFCGEIIKVDGIGETAELTYIG